ncbi:hypothetical protein D3C79_646800 [compost metagenome]
MPTIANSKPVLAFAAMTFQSLSMTIAGAGLFACRMCSMAPCTKANSGASSGEAAYRGAYPAATNTSLQCSSGAPRADSRACSVLGLALARPVSTQLR